MQDCKDLGFYDLWKKNFIIFPLHLTPFNCVLPAVVEEMCQTVIIASTIGSAVKYCFLMAHPLLKVVSKWRYTSV